MKIDKDLEISKKETRYLKGFIKGINSESDFNKSMEKVDKGIDKKNRGKIKKIWNDVLMLWDYVKDKNVPWTKKSLPIGGLVYLVSPIDAIPDPVLIDDFAVLTAILGIMSAELIKYAKSKEEILTKEITKRTINKAIIGLTAAIVITGITIGLKYFGLY